MANILASSIKNKAHLKAFDDMFAARFAAIDLSALIPNLFETAPADMLPYLAKQYNMLGYNGWRYMDTEQKQRDLLKAWAKIKKLKGTIAGIKYALNWINITPITVRIDPYDLYCDGEFSCNGHFTCGGDNPFNFEISVNSSDVPNLTQTVANDMFELISEFKAARDLLLAVNMNTGELGERAICDDPLHIEVTISGITTLYDI